MNNEAIWARIDSARCKVGDCASDECHRVPEWTFDAGDVRSEYCDPCRRKIVETTGRSTVVQSAVFPITQREADVLHDIGWNSGFGWRDEWDWWQRDAHHDTKGDDDTRLRLYQHLMVIRQAAAHADDMVTWFLTPRRVWPRGGSNE